MIKYIITNITNSFFYTLSYIIINQIIIIINYEHYILYINYINILISINLH